MRGKYWKSICAIPAYMFLLSPSGKRVQKMEGGNWIDQHEAQKVVDSAEDELSDLRAELAGLKTGYEAYERVNAELNQRIANLELCHTASLGVSGIIKSAASELGFDAVGEDSALDYLIGLARKAGALRAECEALRKDATQ